MPLPSRDSQSLNALTSEQPVNVGRPERLICLAAGGLLLATGAARRDAIGAAQSLAGVVLAARGTTGHWPLLHSIGLDTLRNRGDTDAIRVRKLLHVRRSFTIDRPADELFAFWRKLENLPSFMEHLVSVTQLDERRSRWIAEGPLGRKVEWEAEITEEIPGRVIAWHSLEGSSIANSGSVHFDPAPGDRGTEVHVAFEYAPPAGAVGDVIAKLFGGSPEQQIEDDLRHFKQLMEAGEVPTTEGQPAAR